MFFKHVLLLLLIISVSRGEDDRPQVTTTLGVLRGYTRPSHGGRMFSVYEGIPYAKPPIGEKRFQEPEPVEPWIGVLDAIYLTKCVQHEMLNPSSVDGDEDCLYLNVYVPRQVPNPEEKLDVIVHIHGGAYMYGNGRSYANPEYLMDKEVIFVTFNYRLGLFGFLSTEDDVVPGNNGLKDQVLALKWIQNNIASFGGNPDSVTLTGLSAGASSVHLHYLSPMSKGLFHRGFSQSGVALNSFTIQEGALEKARLLGQGVGCTSNNNQVLVHCLKQRHHLQLAVQAKLFQGYLFTPFSPFAPVIEKGGNAFLDRNPYELLVEGLVQDLPWITSNTAHEGMYPGAFLQKNLDEIGEKWQEISPFLLDYNYTLPRSLWATVGTKIKEFYLGGDKITPDNFDTLVKILSDRLFLVDAEIAAKLQAKVNKSPVFYFHFSFAGEHSDTNTVPHGDDAQYFFYKMFRRKEVFFSEIKMKDVMLDMLTSFAKNGKPTIEGVTWEPTTSEVLTYLNISGYNPEEIKLQTLTETSVGEFWKSLGISENENLVQIKDEL